MFKKKKKGIFPHSPSFLGFWPNQPVHPKVRPSFSPWPSAHGPPTPSLSRGRACWPSSTPHGRAPPPPSLDSLTAQTHWPGSFPTFRRTQRGLHHTPDSVAAMTSPWRAPHVSPTLNTDSLHCAASPSSLTEAATSLSRHTTVKP